MKILKSNLLSNFKIRKPNKTQIFHCLFHAMLRNVSRDASQSLIMLIFPKEIVEKAYYFLDNKSIYLNMNSFWPCQLSLPWGSSCKRFEQSHTPLLETHFRPIVSILLYPVCILIIAVNCVKVLMLEVFAAFNSWEKKIEEAIFALFFRF